MKIEVNHQAKITTVWLTRAEQSDPIIKVQLDKLYTDCRAKKHTVAVFHSGERDLCRETSALLCHNRRKSAQLAARGM